MYFLLTKDELIYFWSTIGADPNRNWAWGWMTGGSSNNPCSDTFAGTGPFSEIENLRAAQFLDSIHDQLDFYLSLHSYSQLILLPYGNMTVSN